MDAIFNLDELQQVTVNPFQQETVEEKQGLKPDLVDFEEHQEQKQEEEESLDKHVGAGSDYCTPDLNLGEQEKPVSITIDLGLESTGSDDCSPNLNLGVMGKAVSSTDDLGLKSTASDLKSGLLESRTIDLGLESTGSDECSPNLNSGEQQTHDRGCVSSSYDLGQRSTGCDSCTLNQNSGVVENPGRRILEADMSVSSSDCRGLESTGSVGCSLNLNSGGWQKPKSGRPPKANKHDSKDSGRQVVLALPAQVTNMAVKRINLTIAAGEDVCAAVFSAFQPPDQVVWIISASGTVSSVKLWGETPDDDVAFQGSYSILSLSGSYVTPWYSASHSKMRDLGVTLIGAEDGTVIGGRVTAPLIAESPVRVVLGRYINNTHN